MSRHITVFSLTLVAFSFLGSPSLSAQNDNGGWKLVREPEGAKLYVRNVPNSTDREAKITATLPVPIEEAMAYLSDFSHYKEWVSYYQDSYEVKRNSENDIFGYVAYNEALMHAKMDVVLRLMVHQVGENMVGSFTAEPDVVPKKEGYHRITYFNVSWALRKTNKKNCQFTFLLRVDQQSIAENMEEFIEGNYKDILTLQNIFAAAQAKK